MQYKYRINLVGDNRSELAATLLESFDIEKQTTSDESIYIVAWSRRFRLDELIELSETYPLSEMTVDVMQDTIQLRCTISAGDVIWVWEVDFTLDVDPDLSCLCETSEDGNTFLPAIVPEEASILSTLRCWGWSGDEVKVKKYSEVEIAELRMVTNSQIKDLVQAGSTQVNSVDREAERTREPVGKPVCVEDFYPEESEKDDDEPKMSVEEFYEKLANIDCGPAPVQRTELTKREYHGQLILDLRGMFDAREGAWNGTNFDFTEDGGLKVDLRKKDCDLIHDILNGLIERWENSLMI